MQHHMLRMKKNVSDFLMFTNMNSNKEKTLSLIPKKFIL